MSKFNSLNQPETIRSLKIPLALIQSHSDHLLDAYPNLSAQQITTLLKAIQTQSILLEHLLDSLSGISQLEKE